MAQAPSVLFGPFINAQGGVTASTAIVTTTGATRLIIMLSMENGSDATVPSVSGVTGTGLTNIQKVSSGTGAAVSGLGLDVEIWMADAPASLAGITVTANLSLSCNVGITVIAVQPGAVPGSLVTQTTWSGTTATCTFAAQSGLSALLTMAAWNFPIGQNGSGGANTNILYQGNGAADFYDSTNPPSTGGSSSLSASNANWTGGIYCGVEFYLPNPAVMLPERYPPRPVLSAPDVQRPIYVQAAAAPVGVHLGPLIRRPPAWVDRGFVEYRGTNQPLVDTALGSFGQGSAATHISTLNIQFRPDGPGQLVLLGVACDGSTTPTLSDDNGVGFQQLAVIGNLTVWWGTTLVAGTDTLHVTFAADQTWEIYGLMVVALSQTVAPRATSAAGASCHETVIPIFSSSQLVYFAYRDTGGSNYIAESGFWMLGASYIPNTRAMSFGFHSGPVQGGQPYVLGDATDGTTNAVVGLELFSLDANLLPWKLGEYLERVPAYLRRPWNPERGQVVGEQLLLPHEAPRLVLPERFARPAWNPERTQLAILPSTPVLPIPWKGSYGPVLPQPSDRRAWQPERTTLLAPGVPIPYVPPPTPVGMQRNWRGPLQPHPTPREWRWPSIVRRGRRW